MPSLTDLVRVIPPDKDEDPEDIFAFAPGLIFTDDLRNLHGDPDSVVVYQSKRFGSIELRTADPEGETERRLFSHYVWNASIKLAELVSSDDVAWHVEGETVLELGAGAALSGIVAVLAGAKGVVISDYPSSVVLSNIRRNTDKALPGEFQSRCSIQGHAWGEFDGAASKQMHCFTRILAADCYWMPSEHRNLVRSMLHFLTLDPAGRVLAVAGFHTGRAKLAAFLECAVEEGLEIEDIYEEDDEGFRREWAKERDGGREDHATRKKWLVVARLKRRHPAL